MIRERLQNKNYFEKDGKIFKREYYSCPVCFSEISVDFEAVLRKSGKYIKVNSTVGYYDKNLILYLPTSNLKAYHIVKQSEFRARTILSSKCTGFWVHKEGCIQQLFLQTLESLNNVSAKLLSRNENYYRLAQDAAKWKNINRQGQGSWLDTFLKNLEYIDTGILKGMPYTDFLKTDYWKLIRQLKLRQTNSTCQLCKTRWNLHVHHTDYKNKGEELFNLGDLVVLCKECHKNHHRK